MRSRTIAHLLAWALSMPAAAAPGDGLVACWNFDEGAGGVLHDRSGNNNHGKIHGATWVRSGKGYALRFDGENDYVDCGNSPSLDITGAVTLQAWVRPHAANRGEPGIAGKFFESYALTYYGNGYWYISSGGNNVSGRLKIGVWTHIAGTFDGSILRIYINGQEAQVKGSKYDRIKHGKNFLMGCIVGDPTHKDAFLRNTGFFPGMIDGVRVHNRALGQKEILRDYNLDAAEKGLEPFDMSRIGRIAAEAFFYPDADKAVLAADFRWALPVAKDEKVIAELAPAGEAGKKTLQCRPLDPNAPRGEDEAEFSLQGLKPGPYELRAAIRNPDGTEKTERVAFRYPLSPVPPLPDPAKRCVGSLPQPVTPPPYRVDVAESGGFTIHVKGQTYRVESSYSYPHGGENRLLADAPDKKGEPAWQVTTSKPDAKSYCVAAGGKHYAIARRIELTPSRIVVKDTILNKSQDVLGVILSNHVHTAGLEGAKVTMMSNPSLFVGTSGSGVGLIALDDLYQLQQRTVHSGGLAQIRTEHFGLDKGASYTIEWAVYPTATNDYFDFINQVRRDEGLNRRVEGAFAFVHRRDPPSKELVALKHLRYASIGCLGRPPDDPSVSLEGWEFTEYPKECAALTKTFAQTKRTHPGVKVMFHVAHALYATSRPAALFGDSRAVGADGRQLHYGPNSLKYYGRYFSKQRFEEGWRWWLFYPTTMNSFGKAMIKATEFMVNELGATGVWADGFVSGYVRGGFSYDRWDGHSVTIDPKTKLVTRKKTCVPYVAIPVLKKVVQIISAKGGVAITNGHPGSRSLWNQDMISSAETGGGDQRPIGGLHLGRTVTPLGKPGAVQNQRDVYRDILEKLDYGALYFWYGDKDLMKHKTLVEHMYPITFESIHVGVVRGKERIVTKKSGVYGWHGDRALHITYLYDARGALTRNGFVTTVDRTGVRMEVALRQDQSAVVVRLPMTLEAAHPVNARVSAYDESGIRASLNGRGAAKIRITDGEFRVVPNRPYRVTMGAKTMSVTSGAQGLEAALGLAGPVELTIRAGK